MVLRIKQLLLSAKNKKATKVHPIFGSLNLRGLFLLYVSPLLKAGVTPVNFFSKIRQFCQRLQPQLSIAYLHIQIFFVCQIFFMQIDFFVL